MSYELKSFPDANTLAAEVARRFFEAVASCDQDSFSVALSGGRITKAFFNEVVEQSKSTGTDLSKVAFFWADERCVPPDDSESNFLMAKSLLFDPLKIAEEKIFRIKGENDPGEAASEIQNQLKSVASETKDGQPVIDLILLGMGEDGHTASLFPGAGPEVIESQETFIPVIGPKPPPQRITLTFAAIAAAKEVWVLASGGGKETALRDTLSDEIKSPLGRVLHSRESSIVFSDIALE